MNLRAHCPFLNALVAAVAVHREPDDAEHALLVRLTTEIVATVRAEVSPGFWRPNRDPAQLNAGARLFELLIRARVLPVDDVDRLVEQLLLLARADHDISLKS